MEEFRVEPCVNAGTADSDRKVTLEDDTFRVGVCTYLRKLEVEVVLDEAPEIDVCAVSLAECSNFLLAVLCISLPLAEVRSSVLVAENAECRIWKKP